MIVFNNQTRRYFSTEEPSSLVEEILFETILNELLSLEDANNFR